MLLCSCGEASKYKSAKEKMAAEDYESAIETFNEIPFYQDSTALIEECNELINSRDIYLEASNLYNERDYLNAATLFESIVDYKDAEDLSKECKYQFAYVTLDRENLLNAHNKQKAFTLLEELGDYKDSQTLLIEKKYQYACQSFEKYNNTSFEAAEIFADIIEYKDSQDLFAQYITISEENIFSQNSGVKGKKNQLTKIKDRIPQGYDILNETYYDGIVKGLSDLINDNDIVSAYQLKSLLKDVDLPQAKKIVQEIEDAYQEYLSANADKTSSHRKVRNEDGTLSAPNDTKQDKEKDSVDPNLKEFLDSYEAFMNQYCDFMEKYDSSNATMVVEYGKLLKEYAEFTKKFESYDPKTMSIADSTYYLEVNSRVIKRLKTIVFDEYSTNSLNNTDESENSLIDPDLKAFLDSYETFIDEYCSFMDKYDSSDIKMLKDYAEMMTKYADFAEKLEAYDSTKMSVTDSAYYLEVMARTTAKLEKVAH